MFKPAAEQIPEQFCQDFGAAVHELNAEQRTEQDRFAHEFGAAVNAINAESDAKTNGFELIL